MTRFRKTLLASAFVAASLTASAPAQAFSFFGLFSVSYAGGLYFHPLPRPVR